MKNKFKIFIDFDGTVTTSDVGESMFLEFGDKKEVKKIIANLLADKISSKECWLALCNSVTRVKKQDLDIFIGKMTIEPTFKDFTSFCNDSGIDYFILSDGFDYYIEKILKREKLSEVKIYANVLEILNDKLIPSFPYLDIDSPESANCKRNHIINNSGDDEYTVFVGDGNSDRNAAQFCDFIFAKNDLLKYCEKERISYYPFDNFNDVKQIMIKLLVKKRLRKRYQAELKRREVYMME